MQQKSGRKLKKMIQSRQEDNRKASGSESSGSFSESEESSDNEETEAEIKTEGEARQSPVATEVSSEEALMTAKTEGEARQPPVTTEEAREEALMTEDLVDLEIECVLEEGDEVVLMTEIVQNDGTETEMTEAVSNDCAEHNPEEGSPVVGEINSEINSV